MTGKWKLVPMEPTLNMVGAFWRQKNTGTQEPCSCGNETSDYDAYRAMIAAAPEFLSGELLDAVGLAIEQAGNPGREGPFGFFDYTSYGDPVPFHVRDFRDPKLDGYGKCVFKTTDRSEGLAAFERETRRHIARSAMSALLAATTPKGNDDAK